MSFVHSNEKDVSSEGDISVYADSEKFPTEDDSIGNSSLYRNAHKMYQRVMYELCDLYGEDFLIQIRLWDIDSGIVEAYSDGTLRPDATLTRAEFAEMLTSFMD